MNEQGNFFDPDDYEKKGFDIAELTNYLIQIRSSINRSLYEGMGPVEWENFVDSLIRIKEYFYGEDPVNQFKNLKNEGAGEALIECQKLITEIIDLTSRIATLKIDHILQEFKDLELLRTEIKQQQLPKLGICFHVWLTEARRTAEGQIEYVPDIVGRMGVEAIVNFAKQTGAYKIVVFVAGGHPQESGGVNMAQVYKNYFQSFAEESNKEGNEKKVIVEVIDQEGEMASSTSGEIVHFSRHLSRYGIRPDMTVEVAASPHLKRVKNLSSNLGLIDKIGHFCSYEGLNIFAKYLHNSSGKGEDNIEKFIRSELLRDREVYDTLERFDGTYEKAIRIITSKMDKKGSAQEAVGKMLSSLKNRVLRGI